MARELLDTKINTAKRMKITPNTVDENKRLKTPHIATMMVSLLNQACLFSSSEYSLTPSFKIVPPLWQILNPLHILSVSGK
jgi:hypothetical protein